MGVHIPPWAEIPVAGHAPVRPGEVLPLSGVVAFHMHDTHGLPVDITQKLIEERGYRFDEREFDAAMQEQRTRARAAMATSDAVFTASVAVKLRDQGVPPTRFVGYEQRTVDSALAGIVGPGDALLDRASAGQEVVLVVPITPFYAQGGGQVGDRGSLRSATGEARIDGTTALDGFHLHKATVLHGQLERGQACTLQVDAVARAATERNHTATHLLHAALKQVLGNHVAQAGSEVSPERLRFDYTQPEKPTAAQLQQVEDLVNEQVLRATPVLAVVRGLDEARSLGYVALFGEKYGDRVRTLQVGEFSKELCGGTHVHNSGSIGALRITSETAISAGTRRLEAVTGTVALQQARQERQLLADLAGMLKVRPHEVGTRVGELAEELKRVKKDLEQALAPDLDQELQQLQQKVQRHGDAHTLLLERPGLLAKDAQDLLKRAQQAHSPLAAVLFSVGDGEVLVVAAVSAPLLARVKAGDLVKAATTVLGGGGGGRPEMAQGKGKDAAKLPAAVAAVTAALRAAGLCG